MRKSIYTFLIILLFALGADFNAQAGTISPDLQLVLEGASPDQEIDIIVILTDQVDTKALADTKTLKDKSLLRSEIIKELKSKADKTQKELLKFLDDKKAKKSLSFWIFNGLAVTVRTDLIPELAGRPEVAEVRLDFAITLAEPIPATASTPEWNIDAIRAPELWNLGFSGQNIVVANMDSGVDWIHNDLSGRWRAGTNSWFDPYDQWAEPHDSHPAGHGTGTMGIMVGGDATGTAIGVAPGAQWIAVKLFDDAGFADSSAIHLSFQWLLDPDGDPSTDDAPDVVNNSWGYRSLVDVCFLEFQQDIQALKSSEIAVIFSAGNEGFLGPASSISPANNPESFAVGSVSDTLDIAFTSSRGPSACVLENDFFPEVVAPGVSVKTADRTSGSDFDTAAFRSGTSFAGPHVAGAMALLLNAFPGLTVADVEAAVMETAVDLGDIGPDNEYGYGLIDVMAAYRSLVPCTDADSDGYYAEAVCGTALDCNDNDDTIHPGVLEEKHDGIDQDCNGYDLTIEILSAVYYATTTELEVIATSTMGNGAALVLLGYGPMSWNAAQLRWEITVVAVGGDPGTVSVSGIEGAEIAATQQCTDTDGDGYFIEALCGGAPDCNDNDNTVYPGATEIKGDGIDQDCNGSDLTIEILSAYYNATTDELEVLATSGQDDAADLQLVGFGPMIWNPGQLRWEITVTDVLSNPGSVTVSGVEGSEVEPTAPCTDGDIDGYYPAAVCGTPPDCNDNDDTIHPGALEEKHDGIDQDCNGHDLTIDILSAVYYATTNELEVRATSTLAETAALVLLGHGSMIWNSVQGSWEITVAGVGGDPGTVSVSGIEGSEVATTQQCTNTDGDGFFAEAVCGTLPDCIDTDNTIYPGASEVKHDGIDQDCNDYDLTIEILSAVYYTTTNELEVMATSTLAGTAALELDGHAPMSWNAAQLRWEITVAAVGADPGTVSVSGIEGSEVATTQQCTNTDGDGYFIEALCGGAPDCNDNDDTVNPGASEVKHDGIDQDCNGSDLTIEILSAYYNATTDELEVLATSGQDDAADLQLVGFGPMIWNLSQLRWEITVTDVLSNPGSVTVSGIEGSEALPTAPCTDADLDGYYPAAVCGIPLDCNDTDDTIYPGAAEVKHDGTDQDCNDYDLTIEILSAVYYTTTNELEVMATSTLAGTAALELDGHGPMIWNPGQLRWEITAPGVGADPGNVSVSGIEGAEIATTQQCTNTDGDGFFAEAVCGTLPDCIDTDNTIYPGASEVKHDGIDQDCNDYDLTIEILSAVYYTTTNELEVMATSTLAGTAALELDGHAPMSWNAAQLRWEITVAAVGADPGTVSVSGIEGSEVATTQQCTNTDGDGFFAEAVCGTLPDCNDDDNTVYPGAPEIKGDGIDQDCNGHDLTIVILSTVYNATTDELEVLATSDLAGTAALELIGFGPMTWNPDASRWEITVTGAGGETGEITVFGIEGTESASSVPCTDADVDGFYPFAVCGTALDCDDDDPASYPGAVEIKHDGIDQDCNEYDLTIDIPSAAYLNGDDVLCVTAASILGESANLVLVSSGPMTWSFERQQWEIAVTGVGGDPGQISVQGTEGTETAGTTATVLCKGDLDGDGDVDVDDLAMFAPAFGSVNPMPNYDPAADLDGGGDVDANDLKILIANFGSTECPSCP